MNALQAKGLPLIHRIATSHGELLTVLDEAPFRILMIDILRDGQIDHDLVQALERRKEGLPVHIYSDFSGVSIGQAFSALKGTHIGHVITYGVDDSLSRLVSLLHASLTQPVVERALTALVDRLDWRQALLIRWLVRQGGGPNHVEAAASALGVSPRTIRRWFSPSPAVTPARVVSWVRVLHACVLMSEFNVPVGQSAVAVGFSSPSDLYRRYSSLTGLRLADVPRAELLDRAIESFSHQLTVAG